MIADKALARESLVESPAAEPLSHSVPLLGAHLDRLFIRFRLRRIVIEVAPRANV